MDHFAELGGELFQLDAGWYAGIGARDQWDFTAGLGSWAVDRSRFPEGLGVLADHAHARGLRFGVWVEPERVALSTVGRAGGAEERFLATADGQYQPGTPNDQAAAAQICLSDRAARQWVLDRLVRLIDEARPDYLKWDVNFWIRCTRPDHDHTSDGGNYGHVMGLYEILGELRARYPALLIENCSGGGHRIDAELLTRTDASWMDDRSSPSARVRSHLEGLGAVVPASALLSYLMPGEGEPMAGADDMRPLARSRMPGAMGLTVPFSTLGELQWNQLAQELALYHSIRQQRGAAVTLPLSDAVRPDGSGAGWDVLQQLNPASGNAVVFGFRNEGGDPRVRVRLQRLERSATYSVRHIDTGTVGQYTGAELMDAGIELAVAASHVAYVTRH
jgi:alpha-galactosidase